MNKIAKLSIEDRKELFSNTANKIGMHPAIVEKDFWVCYMLDYLFIDVNGENHLRLKVVQVYQKHTI